MKNRLTTGCDKLSRVYEDMFNTLQEVMLDEDKIKNLSPLDYSALGLYIGKFVEQEINSSVVQIMRDFRGVEMPDYYCKYYPYPIKPVISSYWDELSQFDGLVHFYSNEEDIELRR